MTQNALKYERGFATWLIDWLTHYSDLTYGRVLNGLQHSRDNEQLRVILEWLDENIVDRCGNPTDIAKAMMLSESIY